MLSLVADSISTGGHRLLTILLDGAQHTLDALSAHGAAVTGATGTAVVTAPIDLLTAFTPALTRLLDAPTPLGAGGLHAPFVTDAERGRLDLSMCGVIACARAGRGGRAGITLADDATRYVLMLLGQPPGTDPMHHVALPLEHPAFTRHQVGAGRYPGWLTWGEMITRRAR